MSSLILTTTSRLLMPLLFLFSLVLLLRGHHEPGGGFVGGLVAAAAFALVAFAEGVAAARRALHVRPLRLIALGLSVALVAGALGLCARGAFLTGVWAATELPVIGEPGTPLLFDAGVYLAVLGTVSAVVLRLMEADG